MEFDQIFLNESILEWKNYYIDYIEINKKID